MAYLANAASAISAFSPDGNDWIVTVRQRNGGVFTRRVTPGSLVEDAALSFALLAQGVARMDVVDTTVRRAGAPRIEAVAASDPFLEIMRRMRTE